MGENSLRNVSVPSQVIHDHKKFLSGPLRERMPSFKKVAGDVDR